MPSRNLYPPTVDSYQAAFDATTDSCKIYFSLSKFSTSASGVKGIQLSIVNQATGVSVINKSITSTKTRVTYNEVYSSTGVLIINNTSAWKYVAVTGQDNLYYIEVPSDWIIGGWEPGKIYKAQIRLSEIIFDPSSDGQAAWLANNTVSFSEWSTYTILKATGASSITLSSPDWSSDTSSDSNTTSIVQYQTTTFELEGEYFNTDTDETLNCYEIEIYDEAGDVLLDSSGKLYQNKTLHPNKLYYLSPYELTKDETYLIKIHFITINKYENTYSFSMKANWVSIKQEDYTVELLSAEHDNPKVMKKYSLVEDENEEGRVALKIYVNSSAPISNNFIIRRASSKDNFVKWYDIKIINCNNKDPNSLDVFYDYTIESGVYYKYGVQTFKNNIRGVFNTANTILIRRDFEYSYLLGEGGQQLKLKFDNTMENFTPNVSDSKTDTIGGKYPFIKRNGNMDYRSFPINGLISFHMDDQNTFTQRNKLIVDDNVLSNYNADAENIFQAYLDPEDSSLTDKKYIRWDSHNESDAMDPKYYAGSSTPDSSWVYDYDGNLYDVFYERAFREEAIDFLKNDKPKLFKSPTEGNIMIRLTDVKLTPNQSLGRMIYSFTSTAYEVMEATLANMESLGISDEGDTSESFTTTEYHIGQYLLENYTVTEDDEPDLVDLIYQKYDRTNYKIVSSEYKLTKIYNMSLDFESAPTLIKNNDETTAVGYNISLNGNQITIYAQRPRTYVLDDSIELVPKSDELLILPGDDTTGADNTMTITVNFLYQMEVSDYVEHVTKSYSQTSGIGQIVDSFDADTNLYKVVYNKYFINWAAENGGNSYMRYLNTLTWACLEAPPNAVFKIQDASDDTNADQHRINYTGILNLEDLTDTFYNIVYLGIWDEVTGKIRKVPSDIILDYYYDLVAESY